MAKKKKEAINLLPQEEFAASTLGRILAWLLSSFRMIVVATEMVVMGAFLSRFWLDARNTDLNDAIKQKSAIITSYVQVESDFRSVQKKLLIFSGIAKGATTTSLLSIATNALPSGVSLSTFSFTSTELQIKGDANSESEIQQFITNLASKPAFKDIALSQVSASADGSKLTFVLKSETTTAPAVAVEVQQ